MLKSVAATSMSWGRLPGGMSEKQGETRDKSTFERQVYVEPDKSM